MKTGSTCRKSNYWRRTNMSDETNDRGTSWLLTRITPKEGTVSDLYDKSDDEETEGQKRAIGYLVAAIVIGFILFVVASGGGQ